MISKKLFCNSVLFYLILSLIGFSINLSSQVNKNYFDGPYISLANDSVFIKWIEYGIGHDSIIHFGEATFFERPGLPKVMLDNLDFVHEEESTFVNIPEYVVLSDLHGQFDIFIDLLKVHNVIDSNLQWMFGNKHLVITGDHFSRGDKVMEILWFLFHLEKQAASVGGKVHVLLGNHELMTLNNDLRYLNRKYAYTSGILQIKYDDLFSESSVLGAWLRSKNVGIIIDDVLMVHGGISKNVLAEKLTLEQINATFKDKILKFKAKELYEDKIASLLLGDDGPLWYRGYADSTLFFKNDADTILDYFNVNHIVVGHTSMPEIMTRFDHKIIFIDCNIKLGEKGELLIRKDGAFIRGLQNGDKIQLTKTSASVQSNLFELITSLSRNRSKSTILLKSNMKNLINNKLKEPYQEAVFTLYAPNDSLILSLSGRMRARGNMRKQVCRIPPVKFDFLKKDLKNLNLLNADKLRFVFPCRDRAQDQEKLLKEYFIYELCSLLDTNAVKALLVNFKIINESEKLDHEFTGFILEDQTSYTHRKNALLIGHDKKLVSEGLDRSHFLKMFFFQFMIGNTDWSIFNRHNIWIAKIPGLQKVIALPYDYDYSGFVDQSYAKPFNQLPITRVTQRHFMPYKITEHEFYSTIEYYKSKEREIMQFCEQASYLSDKSISESKKFLNSFFRLLDSPDKLKSSLLPMQ